MYEKIAKAMIEELIERIKKSRCDTMQPLINRETFCSGYEYAKDKFIGIIEPYKVYDELIEKVSSLWDEMSGDESELLLAEIRELLCKIKALSERS